MIEVLNTLSPYIGIAMLAIGVYVIYLTTEDEKKTRKSSKHKR